jgi:uncharacterized membrane protein
VTIVTTGAAYETLHPTLNEQFFAMWILGSKGLTSNYYPNDNANISMGEPVNWTLGVYNHMGGLEYVIVRVKLINSTLPAPNGFNGTASPVPELLEFRRMIIDNDTWSIPFVWKLSNLTRQGPSVIINGLSVNQTALNGFLGSATYGRNFRLVFELWFYDETGEPSFSWSSGGTLRSVWTQIWFNATLTP